MSGNLTVIRVNTDYYIADWAWSAFNLSPIVSVGLGYNRWRYENEDHEAVYSEPSIGVGARIRLTLFNHIFIEYPVLDMFIKPYREKEWIGDAYLNYPEYFGMFMWIKAGISMDFGPY